MTIRAEAGQCKVPNPTFVKCARGVALSALMLTSFAYAGPNQPAAVSRNKAAPGSLATIGGAPSLRNMNNGTRFPVVAAGAPLRQQLGSSRKPTGPAASQASNAAKPLPASVQSIGQRNQGEDN